MFLEQSMKKCQKITNRVRLLSPYSYMCNPIEFAFGKIISIIRDNLTENEKYLSDLIHSALSQTAKVICWFVSFNEDKLRD